MTRRLLTRRSALLQALVSLAVVLLAGSSTSAAAALPASARCAVASVDGGGIDTAVAVVRGKAVAAAIVGCVADVTAQYNAHLKISIEEWQTGAWITVTEVACRQPSSGGQRMMECVASADLLASQVGLYRAVFDLDEPIDLPPTYATLPPRRG